MKALIFPLLVLSTWAIAEPVIRVSQGDGGVLYSRIESTPLSADEIKSVRMRATADVTASTTNITATVNRPVVVKSWHTACFSTMFTTEADYSFVLDIGGQQTTVSEHIVIPNSQRTCVTKELYKQVTFPTRGNYAYSATSTGTTQMAGRKQTTSNAYIFVN
jgi:hypothetical protein